MGNQAKRAVVATLVVVPILAALAVSAISFRYAVLLMLPVGLVTLVVVEKRFPFETQRRLTSERTSTLQPRSPAFWIVAALVASHAFFFAGWGLTALDEAISARSAVPAGATAAIIVGATATIVTFSQKSLRRRTETP